MRADLYNTHLKDRVLWFDGDSSYDPTTLMHSSCKVTYVTEMTDFVAQYNKYAPSDKRIHVKTECSPLDKEWNLPSFYANLHVERYITSILESQLDKWSDSELTGRVTRAQTELAEYKKRGLYGVLRAIIYVINTLSSHNVVWGVGRGSSVSSYILYLIGTHDVDSYAYDLNIEDFLHD